VNAGDNTYKSPFVGSSRVFRYLHCGDFRACPQHVLHSEVKGKKIDAVYLDTTYLDPKVGVQEYIHAASLMTRDQYCFPPQPLVISACAELAHRIVRGDSRLDKNSNTEETLGKDKTWLTDWATRKAKGKAKDNAPDERILVVIG
jgi:DNA cross-link repair 1A protein